MSQCILLWHLETLRFCCSSHVFRVTFRKTRNNFLKQHEMVVPCNGEVLRFYEVELDFYVILFSFGLQKIVSTV